MSIAIIGAGRMGKGLAALFERAGEEVALLGRGATVPKNATVILIATPYTEAESALSAIPKIDHPIVVDMTNPIGPGLALLVGHSTSAAEEIQKRIPGGRVVKAFNTVFAELLGIDYGEHVNPPQVLYAGDDTVAKAEVARLITAIGFEPFDCGPLKMARYLEPMGGLIVDLAYGQGRGTRLAPRLDQY